MPTDSAQWQKQLHDAASEDRKHLSIDVQKMAAVDPQFREAMLGEFDQVKELLRENFTEVFTFISAEHEKTRLHISAEHDKTRETILALQQTILDLSSQFQEKKHANGVQIMDIDVRSSNLFPGNKNFDISAGGTHVTLCFVGKENAKFLEDMSKEVKIGFTLRQPSLELFVKDMLKDLKIRGTAVLHWHDEKNGWHAYFGSITHRDMKKLTDAGKKDVVFTPAGIGWSCVDDGFYLNNSSSPERKRPAEQTRGACSYFQAGKCKNGSECQFQHGSTEVCRFFLRGEHIEICCYSFGFNALFQR
jgi:hypothetical protein